MLKLKLLSNLVSSDIVSPSAEGTVKSSVDTLRSNIAERNNRMLLIPYMKNLSYLINFTQKDLKISPEILKILGIPHLKNC